MNPAAATGASHPVPLSGNKAIELAAISFVLELERSAGREPVDRRYDAAFPADIESQPRLIEVKAVGGRQRGFDLWLERAQVDEARSNPNFWLYVVENVRQGEPAQFRIKVFGGQRLARLISRAKQQTYYTVPMPVREFDDAPGPEAI